MNNLMPGENDWMQRLLGRTPFGGITGINGAIHPAASGGIFASPQINGGLMGDDPAAARRDGLMAAAAQLLAGSGYSPTRRSFGELVGQAMLAGQQARATSMDQAQKRQLQQAQIDAYKAKDTSPVIVPKGSTVLDRATGEAVYTAPDNSDDTTDIKNYKFAQTQGFKGSLADWKKVANDMPATLQEWDFYNHLSPHDQERFVNLKRSVNPYVQTEVAGAPGAFSKQTGTFAPLATTQQEAAGQATIAGAKSGAQEMATKTAGAQFDLPRLEQNIQQSISDIEKLKAHPGLPYITGLASKLPIIPGTPQAGADALAKQVQGQTFLQAYNTLKGGGQITEVEGAKAEAAIGRLQRAQSPAEYKSGLDDLESVLITGLNRARKQAGTKVPVTAPQPIAGPNGMTIAPDQTPNDVAIRAQSYY